MLLQLLMAAGEEGIGDEEILKIEQISTENKLQNGAVK